MKILAKICKSVPTSFTSIFDINIETESKDCFNKIYNIIKIWHYEIQTWNSW